MELLNKQKEDVKVFCKLFIDIYDFQKNIQKGDFQLKGNCIYEFQNLDKKSIDIDFEGCILDIKGAEYKQTGENKYKVYSSQILYEFSIEFTFKVQQECNGLYYWFYQEDIFLTTQSEPNHLSKFLPCYQQFSQNLTLQLFIRANDQIKVISNSKVENIINIQKLYQYGFNIIQDKLEQQIYQFKKIQQLPSRLLGFCAGNFQTIYTKQIVTQTQQKLTMRMIIPANFQEKDFSNVIQLFEFITYNVISFIESYFEIGFPLDKIDYVFCKSSYNGMENVSMIVINLQNLYNGNFMYGELYEYIRKRLISHELLHTIFGHQIPILQSNCMFFKEGCNEYLNNKFQEHLLQIVPSDKKIFERWNFYTLERAIIDNFKHRQTLRLYNTEVTACTFSGQVYQQTLRIFRNLDKIYGSKCVRNFFLKILKKYKYIPIQMSQIFEELTNHFQNQDIKVDVVSQNNTKYDNQQIFDMIIKDYFDTDMFPIIEFNCVNAKIDDKNYITFKTKNCKQILLNIVFFNENQEMITEKTILFLNCKENILNQFEIGFNFQTAYVVFRNFGYYFLKYKADQAQFIEGLTINQLVKKTMKFFQDLEKNKLNEKIFDSISTFNQVQFKYYFDLFIIQLMKKTNHQNDQIKIGIRLKPVNNHESQKFIKIEANQDILQIMDPCIFVDKSQDFSCFVPSKFYFDKVFDQNCTQQYVYENFIDKNIHSFLNGNNQCIFAYGPTGSGKTYSIFGDLKQKQYGISLIGLKKILNKMNQTQNIYISFFQVYNEKIYDLLNENQEQSKIQKIDGQIEIPELKEFKISDFEQAIQIIKTFDKNRIVHKTDFNNVSSRSHSIFKIRIYDKKTKKQSKILFVDLAGSERLKNVNAQGNRLKECQSINKSLTCLGKVVYSLTKKQKPTYIPFRESKLTKVLEDCFQYDNQITFLFTILPLDENYYEILSTLRFAKKVKKIKISNIKKEQKLKSSKITSQQNAENDIAQIFSGNNFIQEDNVQNLFNTLQEKDIIINKLTQEIENYEDMFYQQEEEINLLRQDQVDQQQTDSLNNFTFQIQNNYTYTQDKKIDQRHINQNKIFEFKSDIDKIIFELSQKSDNYKINLLAHDLLRLQRKMTIECHNVDQKYYKYRQSQDKENNCTQNNKIQEINDKANQKKFIKKKQFKVQPLSYLNQIQEIFNYQQKWKIYKIFRNYENIVQNLKSQKLTLRYQNFLRKMIFKYQKSIIQSIKGLMKLI